MVSIIMPMAGLGSRFASTGITTPKPLIRIEDVPMLQLAMAPVRLAFPEAEMICVVLQAHQDQFGIADLLRGMDAGIKIATVPVLTRGALETCLAAAPLVSDPSQPVVALDCDLTFRAPAYIAQLQRLAASGTPDTGLLLSFRSREPRFSYAEFDAAGTFIRTVEKQPVSDHALAGAYGVSSANAFFAAARYVIAHNILAGSGEFYVSSAYNQLAAVGGSVLCADTEAYWSMGTPPELAACLADPAFIAHVAGLKAALSARGIMA